MADGINLKMRMSGDEKVRRDLKKTGTTAGQMGGQMKVASTSTKLLAAGLVAGAAAAYATTRAFQGIIRATVDLAEDLDQIAKKARSIGASVEDLQLLQGAFELSGVESEVLDRSLQKLNQSMGEAMKGTKTYTDAFAALNTTAEDLEGIPLRDRMLAIAQGMDQLGSQAKRAQVAALLFGRAGKDMLVAFSEGEQGLADAIADIERFGIASDTATRQAEDMNDAILRMERAFFGVKVDALEPIIPVITQASEEIADFFVELRKSGQAKEFGETMVRVFLGVFAPAVVHASGIAIKSLAAFEAVAADISVGIFQLKSVFAVLTGDMKGAEAATVGFLGALEDRGQALRDLGATQENVNEISEGFLEILEKLKKGNSEAAESTRKLREETEKTNEIVFGAGTGVVGIEDAEDPRTERDREHFEALADMRITDAELAEQLTRREREIQAQFLLDQQNAAMAVLNATSSFANSISEIISATMGENSEEAKKAARVLFGVQQAAALASATIAMAQAIAQANAAAPPPFNVPGIIQASITGAAQIAAITAATISGVADAGLPPGALKSAGLNQHTVLAVRNDEMVLDPVGTAAISRMLEQRATGQGQPIMVNASVELDGEVLGRSVDNHLVRSSERGLGYERRIRY
jgi:hypothetical protein